MTGSQAEILVIAVVVLMMLAGMIGVFIPVIPDLLLIWAGALVYGLLAGWGDYGPWLFASITLLGIIGVAAEVWVSGWGARRGGAATRSVLGGLLLGVLGIFILGPIGFLLGLLAGIFGLELLRHKDTQQAAQATLGTGVGYGASFVVKLLIALGMISLWVIWVVV